MTSFHTPKRAGSGKAGRASATRPPRDRQAVRSARESCAVTIGRRVAYSVAPSVVRSRDHFAASRVQSRCSDSLLGRLVRWLRGQFNGIGAGRTTPKSWQISQVTTTCFRSDAGGLRIGARPAKPRLPPPDCTIAPNDTRLIPYDGLFLAEASGAAAAEPLSLRYLEGQSAGPRA